MFEYATAYSIAKERKEKVILIKKCLTKNEHDDYKLHFFSISNSDLDTALPHAIIQMIISCPKLKWLMKKCGIKEISLGKTKYALQINADFREWRKKDEENLVLDGYWQNPRYFERYKEEIIKEFSINYHLSAQVSEIQQEMINGVSVSVHIRRGDYLNAKNRQYCIKDDYYTFLRERIIKEYPDAVFYVFSDDINWTKERFPHDQIIDVETETKDIDEMYLMSCCKINICANSTYSWWAAYLNKNREKKVYYPERVWNNQIIPSDWIVVKNASIESGEEMYI